MVGSTVYGDIHRITRQTVISGGTDYGDIHHHHPKIHPEPCVPEGEHIVYIYVRAETNRVLILSVYAGERAYARIGCGRKCDPSDRMDHGMVRLCS